MANKKSYGGRNFFARDITPTPGEEYLGEKFLKDIHPVSSFLYPFIIEFALIGASFFFVMSNHIKIQ